MLAGLTLLAASLAPMLGLGPETSTVTEPMRGGYVSAPLSNGPSSIAGDVNAAVPAILDRPVDGVAFTLRVPCIGYAATVYEGVDAKTLLRGPGHYPSTAWPGHPGNVGIAAHNVYWLSFSRLKGGDRLEVQTRRGQFLYEITRIAVTEPTDRSVLAPTSQRTVTLTTCFPLWAGAYATRRLVFVAREIGGVT